MSNLRLRNVAARVAALMESVPRLQDELDYAVGAIYALFRAEELEYKDRDYPLPPAYQKAPLTRAKDMSEGKVRKEGAWVAGFYFNYALVRIAADYHRVLKVLTGKDDHAKSLAKRLAPGFVHTHLDKVHDEVNALKHRPDGLAAGRKVKFEEAVQALEELLSVIENRKTELTQ